MDGPAGRNGVAGGPRHTGPLKPAIVPFSTGFPGFRAPGRRAPTGFCPGACTPAEAPRGGIPDAADSPGNSVSAAFRRYGGGRILRWLAMATRRSGICSWQERRRIPPDTRFSGGMSTPLLRKDAASWRPGSLFARSAPLRGPGVRTGARHARKQSVLTRGLRKDAAPWRPGSLFARSAHPWADSRAKHPCFAQPRSPAARTRLTAASGSTLRWQGLAV